MRFSSWTAFIIGFLGFLSTSISIPWHCSAAADITRVTSIPITLLHTNDLHSHLQPEKSLLNLGGFARLKTKIDQIRNTTPHVLLVDGGDFLEGNIYYTEGMGAETLKFMNQMGYDAGVAGNHDWINGPDVLLNTLIQVQPKMQLLAANLDVTPYERSVEFKKWIKPFVIREIQGVKIAFIGITTYEFIYDKFIAPIQITEPYSSTATLATELKKQVDVVIGISHNSIATNQKILANAYDLDLIVGAHDHVQLNQPIVVDQGSGKKAWIVETGSWGRYLGRVDFQVTPKKTIQWGQAQLIQIDPSIPADPDFTSQISELEARITKRMGPIFEDDVAENTIEFDRHGINDAMVNLATDAYLDATHADFSLDVVKFIYGNLHSGPVHSADVFNANPAVYHSATQKTWTLKTLPVSGRMLKLLLNIAYATKKFGEFSLIGVSGMTFQFDPLFHTELSLTSAHDISDSFHAPGLTPELDSVGLESIPMVQNIQIQGKPIESSKMYRMATGGGMIEAIQFFNSHFFKLISLEPLEDTEQENWRIISSYLHNHSPVTSNKMNQPERIQTLRADLGIDSQNFQWTPEKEITLGTSVPDPLSHHPLTQKGMMGQIIVHIKNFGVAASEYCETQLPKLTLYYNLNGTNLALDPDYQKISPSLDIPNLEPGAEKSFSVHVTLPEYQNLYGVTARIEGNDNDVNHANDNLTQWFSVTDHK